VGEATTRVVERPARGLLARARGLRALPIQRLLRGAQSVAYYLVVAPLAARLPASLAYRIACWRGDCCFWYRAGKRSDIVRNLRRVLGGEVAPEQAERLAREFFRLRSCEVIDVMRLRGRARSLGKLVQIRGREHLDAALAAGKGAILCTAHLGSASARVPCFMPTGTRSLPSGARGGDTNLVHLPPSAGSGTLSTPGACSATGSGRTSSPGLAGYGSWYRPQSHFMPMKW
jgi:hypothetical protein